jgi:hypothetical protein
LKYKSLKQLRDFLLDGTELQVIERKRYYQSKDYVPETNSDAAKKKTQAKPKEDKNAENKKSKGNKKNNQTQLLTDNYNLISSDDKVLACFNMNVLAGVLDGSGKEVEQKFSFKMKSEQARNREEVPSTAASGILRKYFWLLFFLFGFSIICISFNVTIYKLTIDYRCFPEMNWRLLSIK